MIRIFFIALCFAIGQFASAQTVYQPFKGKVQSIQLSTGVNLQFVEQGNAKGIPVVLLHGYTDSWHSYETTLPFLPESFHVFALSQRGHGDSDRPLQNYHPKDFAADVAAFIKQKNLGPVVIVGHSLGGSIAQQFVLNYPKLVKALVIVGSDVAFKNNPGVPEFIAEINKLTDPVPFEFADGFQRSTEVKPIDSNFHKVAVAETLKLPAYVWKEIGAGILATDFTNELHKIKQPTLIVWGDKDAICQLAGQKIMSERIRNSKLLIYEGTGHAVHWEEPARFAKDLTDFIQNNIGTRQMSK